MTNPAFPLAKKVLGAPTTTDVSFLGVEFGIWENWTHRKAVNALLKSGLFKRAPNPRYIISLDGEAAVRFSPLNGRSHRFILEA